MLLFFKPLFETSALSEHENNALWASSLMAMPPPSPEVHPVAGLPVANLAEVNLTQWASYIQDVASGMRWLPLAATNCPQEDIIGILNRLEALTPMKYCRHCFGIGYGCRCTKVPCQAPSQSPPLWVPPTMSYATMVATTTTTASSSVACVPPLRHPSLEPPPGYPTLPQPGSLLINAGVGRGHGLRQPAAGPWAPLALGPHQV